MRRLHLFEFEDQAWFPAPLRRAMTSYLVSAYGVTPFPKLWAERLAKLMNRDEVTEIVDLGSGSGGPVPQVVKALEESGYRVRVLLTDLYPDQGKAWTDDATRYFPQPVDAARTPPELSGIRTMFASFHHFQPEAAKSILRDAFAQRRPLCILEATSRTPGAVASAVLIPILVLVLTPAIRPVSWIQLLFTYLIPILPLLIFWDGLISQLRTYSAEELNEFATDLQAEDYAWETGTIEIPRLPARVPYLIGRPLAPTAR
jgi:hypothetical protein